MYVTRHPALFFAELTSSHVCTLCDLLGKGLNIQ